MRPKVNRARSSPALFPAPRRRGLAEPYLTRALWTIEGHLLTLRWRRWQQDSGSRLDAITAGSDPEAALWGEYLQLTYLENAREGLLTTLQALRQPHGRSE